MDINLLFEKNYHTIYSYINNIIRDSDDAKDVTQMAFMHMYDKIHMYDSSKPFINWAITVAKNFAIDYKRKTNRENAIITNIRNNLGTSLAIAIDPNDNDDFDDSNIYGKYRIIYMMYDKMGLKLREIEDITGLPKGTISYNISKCRHDHLNRIKNGS